MPIGALWIPSYTWLIGVGAKSAYRYATVYYTMLGGSFIGRLHLDEGGSFEGGAGGVWHGSKQQPAPLTTASAQCVYHSYWWTRQDWTDDP